MAGVNEKERADCPQCEQATREANGDAGADEGRGWGDPDDVWNQRVRGETPLQREDRRYGELLQEVRVAQTGVQILLAFLLTVAFSPRFTSLEPHHRTIYLVTLLFGAGATALLIAPVSIHRLTFAQGLKPQLVSVANVLTVFGLTLLVLTIGAALLLIFDLVLGLSTAVWLTVGVLLWFAAWWYVLPVIIRLRHRHRPDQHRLAHESHDDHADHSHDHVDDRHDDADHRHDDADHRDEHGGHRHEPARAAQARADGR